MKQPLDILHLEKIWAVHLCKSLMVTSCHGNQREVVRILYILLQDMSECSYHKKFNICLKQWHLALRSRSAHLHKFCSWLEYNKMVCALCSVFPTLQKWNNSWASPAAVAQGPQCHKNYLHHKVSICSSSVLLLIIARLQCVASRTVSIRKLYLAHELIIAKEKRHFKKNNNKPWYKRATPECTYDL